MAVILGSTTTVAVGGSTDGFQSVSWNTNVTNNKLWQVGSWLPYAIQVSIVETVNLTTYAGVISNYTISPSDDCVNAPTTTVVIDPQACGAQSVDGVNGSFYTLSYSYSKSDPVGFGTESWSFQRWVDSTNVTIAGYTVVGQGLPSFVLQGMAEGTWSADGMSQSQVGVGGGLEAVASTQGSVSAGFPGLGNATDVHNVTMTQGDTVGGGTLAVAGTGSSSISMPHQPLYI